MPTHLPCSLLHLEVIVHRKLQLSAGLACDMVCCYDASATSHFDEHNRNVGQQISLSLSLRTKTGLM